MSISPEELAERVNRLKRSYAEKLPEKLRDLAACTEALLASWSEAQMMDAARMAHNLAGTGQTFGFPHVGAAARALEDAILQTKAAQSAAGVGLPEAVQQVVEAAGRAGVDLSNVPR